MKAIVTPIAYISARQLFKAASCACLVSIALLCSTASADDELQAQSNCMVYCLYTTPGTMNL